MLLKDAHLSTAGGYTVIVGNNVVSVDSETALPDSVFRAFLHGYGSLGAPATEGLIALSPIAAFLGNGPMIAWGHASTEIRTGQQWLMTSANSVWAARYTDGMWSAPRQLYKGLLIDWRRSGNLLVDASGRGHLLFIDDKMNPSILVHVMVSERPILDSLAIGYGNSLTVSEVRSGGILAAYAGQDKETDTPGVYVTAWDDGRTWRRPELVMETRLGDAKDLLLVGGDSGVSLLWRNANGMRIMTSKDGGTSWTLTKGRPIP
jgi:hypothetical protein